MFSRKPYPAELSFLMIWHGVLSGGMLVAFLTTEASYAMHLFSGTVVLLAIIIRVLVGLIVPARTPLSIGIDMAHIPHLANDGWSFLSHSKKILKDIVALLLVITIGGAALSGWVIFDFAGDNDFHEGVSVFAGVLISVHIALVIIFHWFKEFSCKV